jgi:hypothetical protein
VSEHLPAETEDNQRTSLFTQLWEINWRVGLPQYKDGFLAPDRKFEVILSDNTARHVQDVHGQ